MNKKIIIIGAGISGLVTAYNLQKQGFEVTILESTASVGGRMTTLKVEDFIIDGGAQFLSSGYSIISDLINELGLSFEFIKTSPYVGIVKGGKICKFRYDNPFSLLKVLSFKDWLSMGIGGYKLQKAIKSLPVNDYSAWADFDDESTRKWSDSFYTQGVTKYFLEPMLEAFYFQTPEETSKALPIALTKFTLEKAKTMTLKGGINLLAQQLSKNLDIRLNTTVNDITIKDVKVEIKTNQNVFIADKVIITTPAPITKTFYTPINDYEKELLETPYSSTINISIGLKERLGQKNLNEIYGIWIPRNERDNIAAITIERFKSPDRVKKGELLNIMLSGKTGKKMMKMSEEKIILQVLKELEFYIPNISNKIAFTKLFKWRYAEPLSQIGRAKNIEKYRKNMNKDSLVYLAGDYMSMPFTEGAAESGLWVALKLQEHNKSLERNI